MKRNFVWVALLVGILLLFTAMQVVAAPLADKPTPNAKPEQAQGGKPEDQGQKKGKVQNYKGDITVKTANGFTLTLKDGSTLSFVLTNGAKINIPSVKNATLEDILVGEQAHVMSRADSAGKPVVQKVQVIPGKPSKIHRVGTVTAYAPESSITVQDKDGNSTTFTLTGDVKILPADRAKSLATGAKVTIISRRNPAGGKPAAQGIVIHGADESEDD